MVVPHEPGFGRVSLVCAEVTDSVLEDVWPRCVGGVVHDLFLPCHKGGAVVFIIGVTDGCEDNESGHESLAIGERRQEFGFSCDNFLLAGLEIGKNAVN
jgi:hypothetical protein